VAFYHAQKALKSFSAGAGGAYDTPDSLVGLEGKTPSPLPFSSTPSAFRSRLLDPRALGDGLSPPNWKSWRCHSTFRVLINARGRGVYWKFLRHMRRTTPYIQVQLPCTVRI